MSDTPDRVLSDLLDKIDKLTNHIIEMKGEMYKRTDWQSDSTRIYDHIDAVQTQLMLSLREAIGALDRTVEGVKHDYATNDSLEAIRLLVTQLVPRSEHMTRWENETKRFFAIESRLGLVEKRALPAFIVASIGTIFGAVVSYIVGQLIHTATSVTPLITHAPIH